MVTEEIKNLGKQFHKALINLNSNIASLRQFYKYLHPVAREIDEKNIDGYRSKVKRIREALEESKKLSKKEQLKIIADITPALEELEKIIIPTPTVNTEILFNNIVITLCSYLEILISDLAKLFYLNSEGGLIDKSEVTFGEIKYLQTVNEIKEHLIDRKLFELTSASFDDWLNFLTTKVDLKIEPLTDYYHIPIKEIFERRNLVVHNNGVINKKYLNAVDKTYISKLGNNIKLGERIVTNQSYINNSFRYVENFAVLVAHCLWFKLCGKNENTRERDRREGEINNYIYIKVKSDEFGTAEEFGRFVMNNFKFGSKYIDLCVKVNYWQSLKWQSKLDDPLKRDIEKIELADKNNKIKMVVYALLDKKEDFFKVAKAAVKNREIYKSELTVWPIFKVMREDIRFGKLVKGKAR